MKSWCGYYARRSSGRKAPAVYDAAAGFTLLELIMTIMILAIMTVLSFFCFDAVVASWNAGMEMSESMAQADYVMNQIESGLRSAYYSESVLNVDERGFQLIDDGEGESARDSITWMKEGRAFVGSLKAVDGKTEIAEMPHRVMLYIEDGGRDEDGGLMAKAWSSDFQPDEFEVEEDVKAFQVSSRVTAMECKVLEKPPSVNDKELKWEDEWTSSNQLPYKVSITLYMRPTKRGADPVAVTRDIEIPVWDVSQNPVAQDGTSEGRRGDTGDADTGGPGRPPGTSPDGGRGPGGGRMPGDGRIPGGTGGRMPGGMGGGGGP